MLEYEIRPGTPDDEGALLALFDEAVAWMVARGQTGQWGDRAFSERAETRARVREFAEHPGLWLGDRAGRPPGARARAPRASRAGGAARRALAARRTHRRRPPSPRRADRPLRALHRAADLLAPARGQRDRRAGRPARPRAPRGAA